MASRPLWRQAFDLVERAAGSRLETYVQTEGFAELLGTAEHLQAGLRQQLTRRAWHLINLRVRRRPRPSAGGPVA